MKKTIVVYLVAAVVAVGAAILALDYMKPKGPNYEEILARASSVTLEIPVERVFAEFLDGFLRSVARQAEEYKNQRRVFLELAKPVNLRDPAYVEENYRMAQTLLPQLKVRMENLMRTFSEADKSARQILIRAPETKQREILQSWRDMKSKQTNMYIGFFSFEEQILNAQSQLLNLYYDKRNEIVVDVGSNSIKMANEGDEERQAALLHSLKSLDREQARTLLPAQ